MQDLLLKFVFSVGLFLIIFHSVIFHFIKYDEKPARKSTHVIRQQKIRQSKPLVNQPLPSKIRPNNKLNTTPRVISKKTSTYKNNKKTPQNVISKRKSIQELSDQYIETVLNKQKRFFKTCYIRHLKNNLATKGSIVLSFNIDSPGRVSDVSIQGGSIKDVTLHNCMKKVVERVTFSHFSGPLTKVFYPIEFY